MKNHEDISGAFLKGPLSGISGRTPDKIYGGLPQETPRGKFSWGTPYKFKYKSLKSRARNSWRNSEPESSDLLKKKNEINSLGTLKAFLDAIPGTTQIIL